MDVIVKVSLRKRVLSGKVGIERPMWCIWQLV